MNKFSFKNTIQEYTRNGEQVESATHKSGVVDQRSKNAENSLSISNEFLIISLILIAIHHIHHQCIHINEHDNQDSAHQ